jgi:hypothetical protein
MSTKKNSQAFLILCNSTSDALIDFYRRIHTSTRKTGDCFVLYHRQQQRLPQKIKKLNHATFTDDVITSLNYTPIGFNLVD